MVLLSSLYRVPSESHSLYIPCTCHGPKGRRFVIAESEVLSIFIPTLFFLFLSVSVSFSLFKKRCRSSVALRLFISLPPLSGFYYDGSKEFNGFFTQINVKR